MADYAKAANAAFTHLIHNPEDTVMSDNLEYYLQNTEADRDNLVNYEAHVSAMQLWVKGN